MENLNEFHFTSQIGMCGGGGISFKKEAYSVLIDEDGEEYWEFDSLEYETTGYVWSLWDHYAGNKAIAVVGDGREQELKDLALESLGLAIQGDWPGSRTLVNSWNWNPIDD